MTVPTDIIAPEPTTTPITFHKDQVRIFDTTLRDGEQCPGASMTFEEKLEVAELLDEMGVDIIEAGFPVASDGDFESVREIAKRTQNAVIAGLSRTSLADIDRCGAAINAGATTINIPDTLGYATPQEYRGLFETVRARVPNSDKAIFSVHCHDDLGMAVAKSLAGVAGGARQIECTINGLGERAGNAALEEIVMAIRTRADVLPYDTGIETTMLNRASKLVSAVTSFPVQYNKAIVGRNAFAHESGIHQHGMLKNRDTYEIMTPESVGVSKTSLVMGKHSGRAAFREKLKEMGYELGENALNDAFKRFKDLADRKKIVYDEDIAALVDDEILNAHDRIKVAALTVIAGTNGPQSAALTLDIDGHKHVHQATGNGPVDAIFNAIRAIVPHEATLELLHVQAVTQGTDGQAEVSVRLSQGGAPSVTGKGADPDTLVASARAYIAALNKLTARGERQHAQHAMGKLFHLPGRPKGNPGPRANASAPGPRIAFGVRGCGCLVTMRISSPLFSWLPILAGPAGVLSRTPA